MNGSFRKRGGRPRLAGAREASGRLSRRISDREKEFRVAQAYWRGFGLGISHGHFAWNADAAHPVLRLVNLGKIDANSFIILLYWMCTDAAIARGWKPREYLRQVTGFDFTTPQGCRAARALAEAQLGPDRIANLDEVAFHAQFRTDATTLRQHLQALWEVWCSHLPRPRG
jgi:hypothetical protein